jgi:hypothetical protein
VRYFIDLFGAGTIAGPCATILFGGTTALMQEPPIPQACVEETRRPLKIADSIFGRTVEQVYRLACVEVDHQHAAEQFRFRTTALSARQAA